MTSKRFSSRVMVSRSSTWTNREGLTRSSFTCTKPPATAAVACDLDLKNRANQSHLSRRSAAKPSVRSISLIDGISRRGCVHGRLDSVAPRALAIRWGAWAQSARCRRVKGQYLQRNSSPSDQECTYSPKSTTVFNVCRQCGFVPFCGTTITYK
jgi:hypothetical protein